MAELKDGEPSPCASCHIMGDVCRNCDDRKEWGQIERKLFTVHGREYEWTFDEMVEQLGVPKEDADGIWSSATAG